MYCNKRNNEDDLLSPERSERTIPEQYQAEEKKLSADVLLGILVEEWGAACIRVTLPESWRRFNVETLGPVRVVFAKTPPHHVWCVEIREAIQQASSFARVLTNEE